MYDTVLFRIGERPYLWRCSEVYALHRYNQAPFTLEEVLKDPDTAVSFYMNQNHELPSVISGIHPWQEVKFSTFLHRADEYLSLHPEISYPIPEEWSEDHWYHLLHEAGLR